MEMRLSSFRLGVEWSSVGLCLWSVGLVSFAVLYRHLIGRWPLSSIPVTVTVTVNRISVLRISVPLSPCRLISHIAFESWNGRVLKWSVFNTGPFQLSKSILQIKRHGDKGETDVLFTVTGIEDKGHRPITWRYSTAEETRPTLQRQRPTLLYSTPRRKEDHLISISCSSLMTSEVI